MEEYIRLEEEKARRHGKVYNWETAMYGKIWCDHKLPESSHRVPLSNHHSRSFVVALGKGLYQKICSCAVCLIRRIDPPSDMSYSVKSNLAVEFFRFNLVSRVCLRRVGQASKPSFLQDLVHLFDLYFQADCCINMVICDLVYEEFPLFRWKNPGPVALYCPPGLRMKYRLSLKNDMPLRDKIIIALINKPVFYRIIHG
ncbi:hypothetical protein Tco_1128597 [Tanacetum coccineum]